MVEQSSDQLNTEYLVTVSPPPPIGPDEVTTASSALISLEDNTQYNFTVSWSVCQERFNATFVFGKIIKHSLGEQTIIIYIIRQVSKESEGDYNSWPRILLVRM